jgi:hypothetical protein
MGLCSGAYFAFQSAARLADPALVGCVAINPLTFYWKEGMSLNASPAHQVQAYRDCTAAFFQPGKWLKLLSGRSKHGIAGAVRMLAGGLLGRAWPRRPAPKEGGDVPDFPLAHPDREDLPGDLDRIVRAGRHLACFFSRSDPGYGLLELHAGRKVNSLCRAAGMSLHFIEDADHTFSRRAARAALATALVEHLSRRYLAPGEG